MILLTTLILLISTLLLGALFFALFCWAVKDGQFKNVEEAKYLLFREEESNRTKV